MESAKVPEHSPDPAPTLGQTLREIVDKKRKTSEDKWLAGMLAQIQPFIAAKVVELTKMATEHSLTSSTYQMDNPASLKSGEPDVFADFHRAMVRLREALLKEFGLGVEIHDYCDGAFGLGGAKRHYVLELSW